MLKIRFYIPQEQVNLIQRFSYDMETRKDIIIQLIITNINSPEILESSTFKKYHDLYAESLSSFEITKSELELFYIPAPLRESLVGITTWDIDFSTNIFSIDYTGNDFDDDPASLEFAVPDEDIEITVVSEIVSNNKSCKWGGNCK